MTNDQDHKPEKLATMGKYLVVFSFKYNAGTVVASFHERAKQEEIFNTIKRTGRLPVLTEDPTNTGAEIATAFKATIDDSYEAKVQINHPLNIQHRNN